MADEIERIMPRPWPGCRSCARQRILRLLLLVASLCATASLHAQVDYRNTPGGTPFVCTPETIYALAQPVAPRGSLLGATDRVAQIFAFDAATGQDTRLAYLDNQPTPNLADNLNGLMVDQHPGDDRLLYVAQVSGTVRLWAYANRPGLGWGWVIAEDFRSEDIPRGAFNKDGIGYLITGAVRPRVFRVSPAADASLYSVAEVGQLIYNTQVEGESSGDVVFDQNNNGWVAVGKDIWKIEAADIAAANAPGTSIPATRQDRPISATGGATPLWSGIAFGPKGFLYLSHNQTVGQRSYWELNDATNVVTRIGTAAGDHEIRDLASCRFPPKPLDPPIVTANKSLAYLNGVAVPATPAPVVRPGDYLTYRIDIANSGGSAATLYRADISETVPTNTASRSADPNLPGIANSFNCGTAPCQMQASSISVDAGRTETLYFIVQADDPLGSTVTTLRNAVAFTRLVDCSSADNDCEEDTPVGPQVQVSKTAQPASGEVVVAGATITYTVSVTVSRSALTGDVVLTDTLRGLTFAAAGAPTSALTCSANQCVLPQGTPPGTYTATYTATVNAGVTGTVGNVIEPSGPDDPECLAAGCETEHAVGSTSVRISKTSTPPSGSEVEPTDVIAYTVTAEVSATTSAAVTLLETLNPGLTFAAVDAAQTSARFDCSAWPTCTLLAGTTAGTYTLVYTATVNDQAQRRVDNVVVVSGSPLDNPVCVVCETEHRVIEADPATLPSRVNVAKTSLPVDGTAVRLGDTIRYTLTARVQDAPLDAPLVLTDTPSRGLVVGELPPDCTLSAATVVCTLPSGSEPDTYTFNYSAAVTTAAAQRVNNNVVPTQAGGSGTPPVCDSCSTSHPVDGAILLRILKTPSVRQVRIGDLVRYTLSIDSVTDIDVIGAVIVDTPPPGFTYVEGSFAIKDLDNAGTLTGTNPIRIEGVDVLPEVTTSITYLMRVGAGVRKGTQINEAVATTPDGLTISATSTAEVEIVSDPLLEESLILGTVFDDRDGDGWQDSAALTGVRAQGGFAAAAYVPSSTTIDRGHGPESVPDASAPLLHGLDVGSIGALESIADDPDTRRVVIRQRLSQPDFTDDFIVTTRQGVTLRMDAAGRTTMEKSGEAAKGRNAAELSVERRVAQGDGGYIVDYVIRNTGIDERGIPGVRIASVEGLLLETDPYGRFHLVGVDGGNEARGRNFILKVDPSTLPQGAAVTTENPLVRRLTPGLPLRFDFGVRLPMQRIEPGRKQLDLVLGEVIFEPGSAHVRSAYLPVIGRIAAKVTEYRGGEVAISANGGEQLAYERAVAVRTALLGQLTENVGKALTVSVRTDLDDPGSRVLGLAAGQTLLGTVLFDTDKSYIRPEFEPLLERIAAALNELGGGVVAIVGHTDVRASHEYNVALGMRRARSVYTALLQRLSPEVRSKVSVESTDDFLAPIDLRRN